MLLLSLGIPRRSDAQDTLYLANGKRIAGYVEKTSRFRTVYRLGPESTSERRTIHSPRFILFADGSTWPQDVPQYQQRKFEKAEAALQGRRQEYSQRNRELRHRILVMAPGFHQTGADGGVSIGLMYDGFVDERGLISIGGAAQYMWGGTMRTGEMDEGELRNNIHLTTLAPTVRYHPAGRKHTLDPAIGLVIPAGRYLLREERYSYRTGPTAIQTEAFFVSPQAELSLGLNTRSAFTFQMAVAAGPQFIRGKFDNGYFTLGLLRMGWRF